MRPIETWSPAQSSSRWRFIGGIGYDDAVFDGGYQVGGERIGFDAGCQRAHCKEEKKRVA
jgi:hypothetical protein